MASRTSLAPLFGCLVPGQGTVVRIGSAVNGLTLLLIEVEIAGVRIDHCWVTMTPDLQQVSPRDRISFIAQVRCYRRRCGTPDFGLEEIRQVRVLQREKKVHIHREKTLLERLQEGKSQRTELARRRAYHNRWRHRVASV